MTPQELKNSILQRAIQGKLVPQDPKEGSGEELLRAVRAEKERLVKEGKIKKEKTLPEIADDEMPFEIPDNWVWGRLQDCGSWGAGSTPPRTQPEYYGGNIPWLKTGDLNDGYISEVPEYITELALEKTSVRLNPAGSVLIAMYGATIGKLGILTVPMTTNQACCACIPFSRIYNKYLFYFLLSNRSSFIGRGEGGAQPNISKEKILCTPIPLPPLAEQRRIVSKLESLQPFVESYARSWNRLEELSNRFPGELRRSLLQRAIEGRLVARDPSEGTGADLLREIQQEKRRLVDEGKIKKEKPLPEIADEEKPFEIPWHWSWVRLGDISDMCLGKMLDKTKNQGLFQPYLRNVNVRWGSFSFDDILEMRFKEEEEERYSIKYDDLVVCEGGEPGRCAVWLDSTRTFKIQKALHRIRFWGKVDSLYAYHLFRLYTQNGYFAQKFTGTTIKHLTGENLTKVLFPLPPLGEQQRIVSKLSELLPLCDRLTSTRR